MCVCEIKTERCELEEQALVVVGGGDSDDRLSGADAVGKGGEDGVGGVQGICHLRGSMGTWMFIWQKRRRGWPGSKGEQ